MSGTKCPDQYDRNEKAPEMPNHLRGLVVFNNGAEKGAPPPASVSPGHFCPVNIKLQQLSGHHPIYGGSESALSLHPRQPDDERIGYLDEKHTQRRCASDSSAAA
jgi:hypothetical protein